MAARPIEIRSRIERKSPGLPRFIVVASRAISGWRLAGTTVVEVTLDGVDIGRRTLKYWGPDRDCWFLELTEAQCASAGVRTGDPVNTEIRLASTDLPEALKRLIASDRTASEAWSSLTDARKRQLAEHVRSAKKPETRRRRARKGLLDVG